MMLYTYGGYKSVFISLGASFILFAFSVRYIFDAKIDQHKQVDEEQNGKK